MRNTADIKLNRMCTMLETEECKKCYCKPMWCLGNILKLEILLNIMNLIGFYFYINRMYGKMVCLQTSKKNFGLRFIKFYSDSFDFEA